MHLDYDFETSCCLLPIRLEESYRWPRVYSITQLRDAFLRNACSLATLHSAKGQCSEGMGFCQLYQFLRRASARPNVFEPDIARRYVVWHSMANQNHSRQLKLQSIVLKSCLYPLFFLHRKTEDWKTEGLGFFKNLRNITTPALCCSYRTPWRGFTVFFSETLLGLTL